jgi:hypothetical protein
MERLSSVDCVGKSRCGSSKREMPAVVRRLLLLTTPAMKVR